jgi:asparagine synthetase B (glutamine-hydrolysing)
MILQNQIKELITAKGGQARPSAAADSTSNVETASKVEKKGETMEEAIKRGVWGIDTSEEVAVLLSGGVDSSVSLKLCQEQGLKVRAFYLKIWLEDGTIFWRHIHTNV